MKAKNPPNKEKKGGRKETKTRTAIGKEKATGWGANHLRPEKYPEEQRNHSKGRNTREIINTQSTTTAKFHYYFDLKAKAAALAAATALAASSLMMGVLAEPAYAASQTYTVNKAGNAIGTGGCNATECTLNEAILEANANDGADTINVNIPGGTGPRTIFPTIELPAITDPVLIDGYSQPEAEENTQPKGATNAKPMVVIDGSSVGGSGANGLVIAEGGAPSTIRGLVINNFPENGIEADDYAGVKIEGNFIGVDASGTVDAGNGDDGVDVSGNASSSGVIIGGFTPASRNLISANGDPGSDADGILLGQGSNHLVAGNLIGTDRNGTSDLGNASNGLYIATKANVGGPAERANTIAFNGNDGVVVAGGEPANILSNSIFSNDGQGIELFGDSGQDPNDVGDADSGTNGLQNYPVIDSAKTPPRRLPS